MQIFGGALFKPIFQFVCGIGDIAIEIMQDIFLTHKTPVSSAIGSVPQYIIRYSPGIIFSGKIPAFDVNFINPQASEDTKQYCSKLMTIDREKLSDSDKGDEAIIRYARDKFKCPEELMRAALDRIKTKDDSASTQWGEKTFSDAQSCTSYLIGMGVHNFVFGASNDDEGQFTISTNEIVSSIFEEATDNYVTVNLAFMTTNIYDIQALSPETIYVDLDDGTQESFKGIFYVEFNYVKGLANGKTSVAKQLQPTIAKWYKTTRLIAIVGLLSILVYVGIRIILSSTGQDKNKYKKMFMDWLTALCLLFILHYIMAFILEISSMLTKIFLNNVMDNQNKDILMSSLRSSIELDQTFRGTASLTIMYIALVILTVTFTVQYLKRVIYMAFLTMIAPLIALTYPLDKIKDGEAQAFNLWLREYIFNSLLQVVHLFVYCLLVGSSMDFILVNPIYGIVAITFIVPAEKFIRKMFGFDKAETVGTLGAAAGGAAVMSMVNKMKQGGVSKGGQQPKEEEASGGSRTKSAKPTWGDTEGAPGAESAQRAVAQGPEREQGEGGEGAESAQKAVAQGPEREQGEGGEGAEGAQKAVAQGPEREQGEGGDDSSKPKIKSKPGFWGGAGAVAKRFTRKGGPLRKLAGAALKGLGGLAGATIGIAAGVASGDLGKALQYGVAGGAAGYAAAGRLGKGISGAVDKAGSYVDTFKQGRDGNSQEAKNKAFDKKFMQSDECKALVDQYTTGDNKKDRAASKKAVQEKIGSMLQYGITDPKQMEKALSKNYTANQTAQYLELAQSCPPNMAHNRNAFKKYIQDHPNPDVQELAKSKSKLDELYKGMHDFM